jgi:hypothetical protein
LALEILCLVARGLAYLSDPHRDLREPYALAQFAIAAAEPGNEQPSSAAVAKLSKLATHEHGGMYWALDHNTPFYGWGHAGRIESTAMTVLALATVDPTAVETRNMIEAGTLWLLREKDHYGVCYSGQATVDVLSALLKGVQNSNVPNADVKLSVLLNGRPAPQLNVSSSHSDAPAIIDISDLMQSGDNTITVQNGSTRSAASMQAVADYYIPWTGTPATESTRASDSDALGLAVKFDKTETRAGDQIRCSVDAERIGSRGWGMMIAEIGLPPGR